MVKRSGTKAKKGGVLSAELALRAEPVTATGKIIWFWPEISAALSIGKKLREVWEAAQADGLQIPYLSYRAQAFIRQSQLQAWIRTLEDIEPENAYATGNFGFPDAGWETIAGA